jgi:sodium transport system ATP-binding protein
MIEVHELTKHYDDLHRGKFTAVDGISFEAKPGEVYGLLGPNGAGKTTVLRILSTVLAPSSGKALINGLDVQRDAERIRHKIGFVSNNTAVYERMTAFEMVAYFGRLYGMSANSVKLRADELFDRLKMNDIRDQLCSKMSTGMRQKVSIARALVHDPPVLIFDEATVGLDVLVARSLLEIVAILRDQGKCIIFSTHIMREVEKLCDRVAIMNHGRILAEGTLKDLQEMHEEDDLEELFFKLLSEHENQVAA